MVSKFKLQNKNIGINQQYEHAIPRGRIKKMVERGFSTAVPINGTLGPKMIPSTTLSGITTIAKSITPLRKFLTVSIIA